jgi:hypothetical protein
MTTKRIITLAAAGVLAAVSTITISASTWLGASAAESGTVHLHLGTDGQRFSWGAEVQNITVGKNSCAIDAPAAQTLINLTSTPTPNSKPGLANFGLGVKESASSGNGNPCAQIASNESLTLRPGSLLNGASFREVALDLELTGNGVARVILSGSAGSRTYELQTGRNITVPANDTTAPYEILTQGGSTTAACAAPNSSGPNSAGDDNCRWTIQPDIRFDTITVTSTVGTVTGTAGTVTVEGGGDFGNNPANDTLFVLDNTAPVAVDDEADLPFGDADVTIDVLANDTDADGNSLAVVNLSPTTNGGSVAVTADDEVLYTPPAGDFAGEDQFTYQASDGIALSNVATVTVRVCGGPTAGDTSPDGLVTGTFTRLDDLTTCKINTVTLELDPTTSSILFEPDGDAAVDVNYRGVISFGPRPLVVDPDTGAIELLLQYDRDGDGTAFEFDPVPWCDNPQFDEDGQVIVGPAGGEQTEVPPGDSWCIASEATVGEGTDQIITTWQVFGLDDPRFL